jgi:RNA 2',3'-cyclic 3'-phosphodiesterase
MSKIRCFCAVDISDDVKNVLKNLQSELKMQFDRVSWTRSEGLHITMKFLGDQEHSEIGEISDALIKACRNFPEVRVDFSGLGFFPGPLRPRVIWVGVKSGGKELINLNKLIEDELAKLKIPRESKRFHPHVTLGRIKSFSKDNTKYQEIELQYKEKSFGSVMADKLIFMQSILKPRGAEYISLGKFEFI